jgi:hypothetical protein
MARSNMLVFDRNKRNILIFICKSYLCSATRDVEKFEKIVDTKPVIPIIERSIR